MQKMQNGIRTSEKTRTGLLKFLSGGRARCRPASRFHGAPVTISVPGQCVHPVPDPGPVQGATSGYKAAKEQRRFYDWKGAEDGKTQEPDEDLSHGNSGGGLRSSRDFQGPGTLPHGPEAGAYTPPGMP